MVPYSSSVILTILALINQYPLSSSAPGLAPSSETRILVPPALASSYSSAPPVATTSTSPSAAVDTTISELLPPPPPPSPSPSVSLLLGLPDCCRLGLLFGVLPRELPPLRCLANSSTMKLAPLALSQAGVSDFLSLPKNELRFDSLSPSGLESPCPWSSATPSSSTPPSSSPWP